MERITSRQNAYIRHVRQLAADGAYRRQQGEYLCDGRKMLLEALSCGAEIRSVLFREEPEAIPGLENAARYTAPAELFDYASPLRSSPGPLFTVALPVHDRAERLNRVIVLEGVQDPGNVGTVIRTANAFGVDAVILTGSCADPYHPKTVRAAMGALFRQRVEQVEPTRLGDYLAGQGLPLYGAALHSEARDLRQLDLTRAAVAIGSEGRGLSEELLALCEQRLIIPMRPDSESLNAAVAAAVIMWEMAK